MRKLGPGTKTDDLEEALAVEDDIAPVAPDRSGWTPHASERRDFWNRIRAFPPEVVIWRRRLLRELAERPWAFHVWLRDSPLKQLQERLDSGIGHLREVARILAVLYGSPDLGNKPDPDRRAGLHHPRPQDPRGGLPAGVRRAEGAVPHLGRAARRPA